MACWLCIKRKDKVRKLWGVKKRIYKSIYANILRWFRHMERVEKSGIAKKIYEWE